MPVSQGYRGEGYVGGKDTWTLLPPQHNLCFTLKYFSINSELPVCVDSCEATPRECLVNTKYPTQESIDTVLVSFWKISIKVHAPGGGFHKSSKHPFWNRHQKVHWLAWRDIRNHFSLVEKGIWEMSGLTWNLKVWMKGVSGLSSPVT